MNFKSCRYWKAKTKEEENDSNKAESDNRFIIEKYSTSEIAELMGSEWEPNGVQAFIRNDYALTNPDAYIACYEPR